MRTRILLTDGPRVTDFFWVEHSGTDVYFGPVGRDSKISYHAQGEIHEKREGRLLWRYQSVPLRELRGYQQLAALGFGGRELGSMPAFEGKKSDTALWIDLRVVPAGSTLNVLIGLVEPRNGQAIQSLIEPSSSDSSSFEPKQLMIATAVEPWVFAVIGWGTPK